MARLTGLLCTFLRWICSSSVASGVLGDAGRLEEIGVASYFDCALLEVNSTQRGHSLRGESCICGIRINLTAQ